jgi:hypothetical protein
VASMGEEGMPRYLIAASRPGFPFAGSQRVAHYPFATIALREGKKSLFAYVWGKRAESALRI